MGKAGARRKLYYVWYKMRYRVPNSVAPTAGATIVAAKDLEEAMELGRPVDMFAGETWAVRLDIDFIDTVGKLRVSYE